MITFSSDSEFFYIDCNGTITTLEKNIWVDSEGDLIIITVDGIRRFSLSETIYPDIETAIIEIRKLTL